VRDEICRRCDSELSWFLKICKRCTILSICKIYIMKMRVGMPVAFVLLQHRNKGTMAHGSAICGTPPAQKQRHMAVPRAFSEVFHPGICLDCSREQQKHFAELNIINPELKSAFGG
jgi:hypothetical protein